MLAKQNGLDLSGIHDQQNHRAARAGKRGRRRKGNGAGGDGSSLGTGKNIARTHLDAVSHQALHHAEPHRTGTDDADAGWHCGHG
jgi:hypothetical protein